MKKQNKVSGPYATATLADEHRDAKDRPFHEIVRDGRSMPRLKVLEREEVLIPLLAQRIAQLPLVSKKVLAMYYYENLPISGIAACFNLPACRIDEILAQTVGLLRNDLSNLSAEISHRRNNGNNNGNNIKANGEAERSILSKSHSFKML